MCIFSKMYIGATWTIENHKNGDSVSLGCFVFSPTVRGSEHKMLKG